MEPHVLLEKYVRKYYADWLGCSRRWCSMYGIPQEAYDLLADVLESLCQKSDTLLFDMLSHENNDERKLFYYVRKALHYKILDYRFKRYRETCPVDSLMYMLQEIPADRDVSDELFAAFREVEAKLRADDFIVPYRQYNGTGRLYRFATHVKTSHGVLAVVRYQATTQDGRNRQFCSRTSAISFLAGQNPPPRMTICRT